MSPIDLERLDTRKAAETHAELLIEKQFLG